jgi:hypothetical protein
MRVREAARRSVRRGALARAAARRTCSVQPGKPAPCAPNRSGTRSIAPAHPARVLRSAPRRGSDRSHSCNGKRRQLRGRRRVLARRRYKLLAETIRGASRPGSSAPATPATTPGGHHSESPRRFVETPAPPTHSTSRYCAIAPAHVKQIDGTTARRSPLQPHRSACLAKEEVRAQGTLCGSETRGPGPHPLLIPTPRCPHAGHLAADLGMQPTLLGEPALSHPRRHVRSASTGSRPRRSSGAEHAPRYSNAGARELR